MWSLGVFSVFTQALYGRRDFKEKQLDAITIALSNEDLIVSLPTGGGKSFVVSGSAAIKNWRNNGITILIEPYASIVTDQSNRSQNEFKTLENKLPADGVGLKAANFKSCAVTGKFRCPLGQSVNFQDPNTLANLACSLCTETSLFVCLPGFCSA